MSLADLKFEMSYNNQDNDIVRGFLNPALKEAVEYDRAVGFFSSTSLMSISVGIKNLVKNKGKIKLICSPKLSEEDILAIQQGYEKRTIIEKALLRDFEEPKNEFEEERLNILSHLISEGILDIKVATMLTNNKIAMFHVKLGIISDVNGDFVAFNGSMNDSINAYYENGETIDVFTSISSDYERAYEKKSYFNRLWDNLEVNVETIDFPKSVVAKVKEYERKSMDLDIDKKEFHVKKPSKKNVPEVPSYIDIRDYQSEAYDNWKGRNYCGIYDMATGTGKTYAALYSIVNLLKEKKNKLGIIICCPYQHLVNQWTEDLDVFGFKYIIGFSESKQKDWKKRLKKEVFNYSHDINKNFCFITTNASFATKFVQDSINKIKGELLIVIDEAHNFGTARLVTLLDERFTYRLALSATLDRHNDLVGTRQLYDFFGEKCIEYTLKMAIDAGMLSRYYYYPIKIYLEDDELERYNKLSEELVKYIRKMPDGTIEYSKKAEMLLIKRARIVAGARMKLIVLEEIIQKFKEDNHLLVYCGSTTVTDYDYVENHASNEEIRQIDAVTSILEKNGITVSKFTSEENAAVREILKSEFDSGNVIQALVAIRCLDEGVNIPSIDKAIILASSTNPKEYIQRRGRILRTYPGKDYATVYDFVTLPRNLDEVNPVMGFEHDLGLVKREITRVKDFAQLSLNEYDSDELISEIENAYGYINFEKGGYDVDE